MKFRRLGTTGLKVSIAGLGCNNFGRRCSADETRDIVHAALDTEINFFDTADVYGPAGLSETYLGQAISGLDRSQIVIATKFANPMGKGTLTRGASRRYIIKAVEDSLQRLGTDYIDLYQQHIPDPETPIEETLRALDDLIRAGKVRYIGHSNFSGWQIADADWTAQSANLNRFVSAQNLYNLVDRRLEREVLPACRQYGLSVLPYFPLASGMLTGKYQRGVEPAVGTRLAAMGPRAGMFMSDQAFGTVENLQTLAAEWDIPLVNLALGWLAAQPEVASVIAGATSIEQVQANAAAIVFELSSDQLERIDEVTRA